METRDPNIDAKGKLFGKWCIREGIWAITNRWQNFMYLLIGSERALLIDTGYGEGNLRAVVEEITDKPVTVINTHGHFDHTGGNGWWPKVLMAQPAAAICRHPFTEEQRRWRDAKPYPDYEISFVREGDRIDLGGRELEVLEIPAHQEGSIALLDRTDRMLFTGDELESGQVLLFVQTSKQTIAQAAAAHRANMEKLLARRSEYDYLCPAHNGCMLCPDGYLADFIALDTALIEGRAKTMPTTAGFGFAPDWGEADTFSAFRPLVRAEYGLASIVYTPEAKG